MRYYFAQTDDLGVLCVDDLGEYNEGETAMLAGMYPDVIYFGLEVQ